LADNEGHRLYHRFPPVPLNNSSNCWLWPNQIRTFSDLDCIVLCIIHIKNCIFTDQNKNTDLSLVPVTLESEIQFTVELFCMASEYHWCVLVWSTLYRKIILFLNVKLCQLNKIYRIWRW